VHSRSGLNWTRTRAYSASLGRFITRDPIGEEGGVNLYDYVANNPVSNNDPSGLCPPKNCLKGYCATGGLPPRNRHFNQPPQFNGPPLGPHFPGPPIPGSNNNQGDPGINGTPYRGTPGFGAFPRPWEKPHRILPPDKGTDYYDCVRKCREINDEDNDAIEECVIWCQEQWGF